MDEKNFDWNDLKLFLAVARTGGLSDAARATGSSAPTLGRRMRVLERNTGVELFRRHARGYDLTEQGRAFFNRVVAIEAGVRPLVRSEAEGGRTLVKLSAGQWTLHALAQRIDEIARAAPTALLRFISSDEFLDINHREAVIGLRNRRPHQAGLAGRRIGAVAFAGYAADPSIKEWIRVTSTAPSARWLAAQADARIAMEVNAAPLARDLALKGVGRVVLPCFIGDGVDGLVRVRGPIPELDHEQWIVSHEEDRFIPAVRQVIDATGETLAALLKSAS